MSISNIPEHSEESPVLIERQSGPLSTTRITGNLLARQGYVVGIEISRSGARQTVALANLEGKILRKERRSLERAPDTQTVLNLINEMLDEITDPERLQEGRILRVGVAVGGLVDAHSGIVRRLHHTQGWNDFPLQDYMAERLETPCIIDNNANAAALAEVTYGVIAGDEHDGRKSEPVALYVGLGRGIGGGLIVNGRIYHGVSSMAGEIGHMLVKENGPECSCGGLGHLEAIASVQGIRRRMAHLSREYSESEQAAHSITEAQITAEQVFRMAADGDKRAQYVAEEVETYIGIALANIIHLINPSVIILGGQVAQAGDLLLVPLRTRVEHLCLAAASKAVRIVQGKLGPEANIVGAITLALQDL
jgi:glucokinase